MALDGGALTGGVAGGGVGALRLLGLLLLLGMLALSACEPWPTGSGPGAEARPGPGLPGYSGCDTIRFAEAASKRLPTDHPVHFVFFDHGRLQPEITSVRDRLGDRPATRRQLQPPGTLGAATILTALPTRSTG